MKPLYKITPLILAKVASISEKIGEVKNAIATYEQIDSFISKRYFICNGKQGFAGGN